MNNLRTMAEVIIAGNLSGRLAIANRMGIQYGTDRNTYEALGYPLEITYADYMAKYKRQDIAKAIIDRPVQATWRGGFEVYESDDDKETVFEKEFRDLYKRLSLNTVFVRLDKLSGIGHYGALLLGLDDIQNKESFMTPVNSGKRKLLYISPFGENNAQIKTINTDATSERYGLPEIYSLTITNAANNGNTNIDVHHSRIIHISDGALESSIYGEPRLESIYNRLMDLEKLVGGSAEMFWRGARPGYHGKADPEFTMTPTMKEDLKQQIDEYEHHLRRILVSEGMDLTALAQQVADPSKHAELQIMMISAVKGIPKRILTGSEIGELSSTQDRDNWFSLIGARRNEFAEPLLIEPFLERCFALGILPAVKDYAISWEPLFEESEEDKARVGSIRTTALKDYASAPAAEQIVSPKAFLQYFLGFDEDTIELMGEMLDAEIDNELDNLEIGGEELR